MPRSLTLVLELEKMPLEHLERCYSLIQLKGPKWRKVLKQSHPEMYNDAIRRATIDSIWYAICKKKGTLIEDRGIFNYAITGVEI